MAWETIETTCIVDADSENDARTKVEKLGYAGDDVVRVDAMVFEVSVRSVTVI